MKVRKNFFLTEFVPPEIWEVWGEDSTRFIDPQLFDIAQFLRDWYAQPIIINNWAGKGKRKYSGFRPSICAVGSDESAHKRGMAIDIRFDNKQTNRNCFTAITGSMRTNFYRDLLILGLTAIESNELTKDNWIHLSTENWNQPHIKIIGG